MPAWLDERDPWLTARLADTAAADAEPRMLRAVAGAMRSWLALARRAVLGEHTTRAAANGEPPPPPEEPPTLDSWPAPEEWTNLLSEAVLPVAALVFTEAWQQVARSATLPGAGPYQQRYLDQVSDRLSRNLWPDGVFEECRYELAEGLAHGESIDQIRDRLGLVLNIDAPSRRIRGRINELKREGLRVPGHLYDAARDADAQWHYYARRIARTEIMGAYNGGQYEKHQAMAEVLGIRRVKRWLATPDTRVRNSHWIAHGQVREADEPFRVGGEDLRYPHDPLGSASETVNCRCTLTWHEQDEADQLRARYEAELPHRTDTEGTPLVGDTRAAVTSANSDITEPGFINPASDEAPADPDNRDYEWAVRTAANVPMEPPADWFTDPQLSAYAKVRVLDSGRVIGHIAPWGVEHAGIPGVTAPRHGNNPAAYAKFHRHPVRTAEGERILTGPLSTAQPSHPRGHAPPRNVTVADVMAHYDDVTFVAADVVAGEDDHGIWVSGSLRPGVSPLQVLALDRYYLSGDWRNGELIAACSVGSPGFYAPDTGVALAASATPEAVAHHDDHGTLVALVASFGAPGTTPTAAPAPADAEAQAWALLRAQRKVAQVDASVQAAARRVMHPVVRAAADRMALPETLIAAAVVDTTPADVTAARNWVEQQGGLPSYIKRIARHLQRKGMSKSRAIATAVNAAKKMCRTGDTNWPGKQQVNPGSRAEACAAVRQWNAMRARARAS